MVNTCLREKRKGSVRYDCIIDQAALKQYLMSFSKRKCYLIEWKAFCILQKQSLSLKEKFGQ